MIVRHKKNNVYLVAKIILWNMYCIKYMRFYWYGGEKYIRMKTKECVICGHKNNVFNSAAVAPLHPIKVTPKIFWRVHVDLTSKLKQTTNGNTYIAIAICAFSKYIEGKGNCSIFLQ